MNKSISLLHITLACLLVAVLLPYPVLADDTTEWVPLGCVPSTPDEYPMGALSVSEMAVGPLPASVDLRSGLPPVGDQGRQNSCVAWAVGYYYKSYQEAIEQQWPLSAPEHQFSPAYIYNQRPTTSCSQDRGMSIAAALRILQQGAAPLSLMPYDGRDACSRPDSTTSALAREYRIGSYTLLFQGAGQADIDRLKARLAGNNPIILAVPVYANFRYAAPGRAVIDVPPPGSPYLGGHAVLAVGYDQNGILIVNSWGTGWGDRGFAYLTYDFVRRYAWEAWVMQDVDATPPTPPVACSQTPLPQAAAVAENAIRIRFDWSGASDRGGSGIQSYRVYWGTDPAGESPYQETDAPSFYGDASIAGQPYYLRVQVIDRAGNASIWKTLSTYVLETLSQPSPADSEPRNETGDSTGKESSRRQFTFRTRTAPSTD